MRSGWLDRNVNERLGEDFTFFIQICLRGAGSYGRSYSANMSPSWYFVMLLACVAANMVMAMLAQATRQTRPE